MRQTDLFGAPVSTQKSPVLKQDSNDIDLMRSVIATAVRDGYALAGTRERPYRRIGDGQLEPVPRYEAEMVEQLIRQGWLEVGGYHKFTYGSHEGRGRSILVPKSTKTAAARWNALAAVPTQQSRSGR